MIEIIDAFGDPAGYVQVASVAAVGGTGIGAIPAHTKSVFIQPAGGDVRWTDDGTAPTAVRGMILPDGATMKYVGKMSALKFIDIGGAAKLNVSFYK